MSLFKFFRKETTEVKAQPSTKPVKTAPVTRVLASAAAPVVAAAAAPAAAPLAPARTAVASEPEPLDLEKIRLELAEIARIVGTEEDSEGTGAGINLDDLTMVDLRLVDIVQIVPDAFRKDANFQPSNETFLSVIIPDLFDQLSHGKVETTVGRLVADIPEDYLTSFVDEHADDKVALPLSMVVSAVQPGELRKRTAAKEKDRGEKLLPNLFSAGSKPVSPVTIAPPSLAEPVVLPLAVEPPAAEPEPAAAESAPEMVAPVAEPVAEVVSEPVEAPAEPVAVEPEPVAVEPEPVAAEPEPVAVEPESVVVEPKPAVEEAISQPSVVEPIVIHEVQAVAEAAAEDVPGPTAAAPVVGPISTAVGDDAAEMVVVDADEEIPLVADLDPASAGVLIAGLDMNRASADEMHTRLDGVGRKLAENIVQEREQHGPYTSIYDLTRVPGLRRATFERVTGLTLKPAQYKYRELIRQILGPDNAMPDVRQVTARFKELPDYVGCLVTLDDGFVLAGSWDHPAADPLGAFAPQMFKKISRYVKQLKLGDLKCLVFFLEAQPVALVKSGRIIFAALLASEKLARKQVELVQALTEELGRRLGG